MSTYTYRITGRDALTHGPDLALSIFKHSDPVDGAREVTYKEAEDIAREDPSLIYCEVTDTADLTAYQDNGGFYVDDSKGGRWFPCPEVNVMLYDSGDPEAAAIMFASVDPLTFGRWGQ